MMIRRASYNILATCLLLTGGQKLFAADDLQGLAQQGTDIVKKHCYMCHGEKFNGSAQFNVMDPVSLIEHGYVVPGNVEDSDIWIRVEDDDMPPEDSGVPPLSAQEKTILKQWIAAGAPQVTRQKRAFKTHRSVIEDIHQDLMHADRDVRPYYRYFSLTHLNNNYSSVSDFNLRLYRAAFCKTINSLSYEPDIYVPPFIDKEETVFRIDMRKLGWQADQWKWLISQYPYGVHYHNHDDRQFSDIDVQIDELSGTNLCWLRADWFINHATRPPIYDRFARIPDHVNELEQRLNVDFSRNYHEDRLARAGFATSGVSNGNRLVERHPALHGYYWKSYDFADKGANGNLFRFPLGPVFEGNDYPALAFEHDGGEMIFSLPNGLQAYMLTDAPGNKIERGPISVVRDSKETSGTAEVLNGLSCMHCHRNGMIDFQDSVRTGVGVFDGAKRKVQNIYPEQAAMDKLVARDRDQFMRAVKECVGPFMLVGDDINKPIDQFAEPIGAIARFYQRDLKIEEVACELGMEDPAFLQQMIQHNRELIRIGLGPLGQNSTIKRADWENTDSFVSPYQETMRILGIATPLN